MATIQETVKETLVGTSREPELSQQTRATFDKHARQDEATGDLYMTEEEFINAIAPKEEDYVSTLTTLSRVDVVVLAVYNSACLTTDFFIAQNQARAICYIISCRRSTENREGNASRLGPLRESTGKARC